MAITWKSAAYAASLAICAAFTLTPTETRADYPEKPINMIVPLGAGGSHDLNARVIASNIPQYLGNLMGVTVITGEGGQAGTKALAAAPADGYTLLFTHNYIDMLQQYVMDLPYNPAEKFVPVVRVNYAPASIIVRNDSPFQTFDDLLEAAKAAPNSVSLGHSGNWGAHFVPAAQIMQQLDVDFDMIGFQGGGPAMQALLAGDLDVAMSFPSGDAGPLAEGKIRVLATAGSERIYEDVPSFEEVGIKGDVGFMHRVVLARADTPPEILKHIETAFDALSRDRTYLKLVKLLNEDVQLLPGKEYEELRRAQAVDYKSLVETLQ